MVALTRFGCASARFGCASAMLGCAAGLLGCAPGISIRGTVRAANDGCPTTPPVEGAALAGARVEVRCNDMPTEHVADVGSDGRFAIIGDGVLDPGCTIHVTKAGYEPAVFLLESLCGVEGTVWAGCYAASLQAELLEEP
jgi:hypothetical protein